ncbi:MAG: MBL fold metallo-hydrolase [Gammaproteobacteria bacterium]|nr:MBL fold metallo-hydrolase [Gammaproteobacteria bacterium]
MKLKFHDEGQDVTCIETHYQRSGLASCYLIQSAGEAALIDTGTARTTDNIMQLLTLFGLAPNQVRYVIPTHVHLDHAGGAGQLMQRLPEAELVIHHAGARHMIDPKKIAAGSSEVYGEEEFARQFVELLPIDEQRVIQATDGMRVVLGKRELTCIDTPGHARHHICIRDSQSGGIFSGDTFGLAYPELTTEQGPFMVLPATPTQFDPENWHQTLDRLMALQPSCMYLTHYGAVRNPEALALTLHQEIDAYVAIALPFADLENPLDALETALWSHFRERLHAHGNRQSPAEQQRLLGMDVRLCAQGLQVWLQRRRK